MKLARRVERRMEQALDGLAGRIFRGGLHSSELAARLARSAELAEFQSAAGPATANHYVLTVNPANLAASTSTLEVELAAVLTEHAAERGWRLEGPVQVRIEGDADVSIGNARCAASVVPGELPAWARLRRANHPDLEIRRNRAIIGRAPDCDLILADREVSRHHALIYRQNGEAYVVDLDSVNGTAVDGKEVARAPVRLQPGAILALAGQEHRFSPAAQPPTSHLPPPNA